MKFENISLDAIIKISLLENMILKLLTYKEKISLAKFPPKLISGNLEVEKTSDDRTWPYKAHHTFAYK